MGKMRLDVTLHKETIEYLKSQKNMSETVDNAVNYYKNREKQQILDKQPKLKAEVEIIG